MNWEKKKKQENWKWNFLQTDIFKIMYKIMTGELQPIKNTNLLFSETGKSTLDAALYLI